MTRYKIVTHLHEIVVANYESKRAAKRNINRLMEHFPGVQLRIVAYRASKRVRVRKVK